MPAYIAPVTVTFRKVLFFQNEHLKKKIMKKNIISNMTKYTYNSPELMYTSEYHEEIDVNSAYMK